MKFYHPEKKDGALNRICHGDVCRCAEGRWHMQEVMSQRRLALCVLIHISLLLIENCSYQRKNNLKEEFVREKTACSAGMDYGTGTCKNGGGNIR